MYSATQIAAGEVPQLLRIGPDTRLVTITAGGNDVGFESVLKRCIKNVKGVLYDGTCIDQDQQVMAAIQQLQPVLVSLYAEIRERAPKAQVLVLSYQYIFPSDPVPFGKCLSSMLDLGQGKVAWMNTKAFDLNYALGQAVKSVPGATSVDTSKAFAGHEVCTTAPWVNGVVPDRVNGSFHPNVDGHKELAKEVLKKI